MNVGHRLRAALLCPALVPFAISAIAWLVMVVAVVVGSDEAPVGRALKDVDSMDCVMGVLFMRVCRSGRQNPKLGDGERQEHGQEAVSPIHNASLPPILYPGVKALRRAADKASHQRRQWPATKVAPSGGHLPALN